MPLIQQTFETSAAAQQAFQRLIDAGIAHADIRLFNSLAPHDNSHERVGSFADVDGTTHDERTEPTGRFDDVGGHRHTAAEDRVGTFADEAPRDYDARTERVGRFADVDRDTETTAADDTTRTLHPSHHAILAQLREAGLSSTEAEAQLAALHAGNALVLVSAPAELVGQVQALLRRA